MIEQKPIRHRCKDGRNLYQNFLSVNNWVVSHLYFNHVHSCPACKQARIDEINEKVKSWKQQS